VNWIKTPNNKFKNKGLPIFQFPNTQNHFEYWYLEHCDLFVFCNLIIAYIIRNDAGFISHPEICSNPLRFNICQLP